MIRVPTHREPTHPGEMLLVSGIISVEQWVDASERAAILSGGAELRKRGAIAFMVIMALAGALWWLRGLLS